MYIYVCRKYIYKYSYNTKAEERVMHSLCVVMHAAGVIGMQKANKVWPSDDLDIFTHVDMLHDKFVQILLAQIFIY